MFTRINQKDVIARFLTAPKPVASGVCRARVLISGEDSLTTIAFPAKYGRFLGAADLKGCIVALSLFPINWDDFKTGERKHLYMVSKIDMLHRSPLGSHEIALEQLEKESSGR